MQRKYIVRGMTNAAGSRHLAEGATGTRSAESGCRWAGLDRQADCPSFRLPHQDGGEHSAAVGDRRLRGDVVWQTARDASAQADLQWRARSQGDCLTLGAAPEEVRELDRAAVGGSAL